MSAATTLPRTEAVAHLKFARIGPRKLRRVADAIRGKSVREALVLLQFAGVFAADPVLKLLKSAVANAENNHDMRSDGLFVTRITVDGGPGGGFTKRLDKASRSNATGCRGLADRASRSASSHRHRGGRDQDVIVEGDKFARMVGTTGIEPVTPPMSRECSPAELRARHNVPRTHGVGTRRRDIPMRRVPRNRKTRDSMGWTTPCGFLDAGSSLPSAGSSFPHSPRARATRLVR